MPAAEHGGMMKHCLLPPLLTALQGAPWLCQHFLLPGTCLNFPPASILTVSPGTVVSFDFVHSSQQCLMWTCGHSHLLAHPSHKPGEILVLCSLPSLPSPG